jgi:hypothetical protein
MNIIIDTNLVHSDWKLKSEDARAFLDFVERTNSTVYIPRVIWEETRINYRGDIYKKHKEYERASKIFGSNLVDVPSLTMVHLDYDEETNKYLQWLQTELNVTEEKNILPYGDFTERIAKRALAKRKPFNKENNHEYKDTLLWETVLDIVAGVTGEPKDDTILISNDGNAFRADKIQLNNNSGKQQKGEKQKGILHAQLQEDIDEVLVLGKTKRFYFYESFGEFLSEHYTPIKGIDKESVRAYIGSSDSTFGAQIWEFLNLDRELITRAVEAVNPAYKVWTDFEQLEISEISSIKDFYISSKLDDKIVASGVAFVILKTPIFYKYSFLREYNLTVNPILEIKLNAEYINGTPVDVRIESVSIVAGEWLNLPKIADHYAIDAEAHKRLISKLEIVWGDANIWNNASAFPHRTLEINDYDYKRWLTVEELDEKKKHEDPPSKYLPRRQIPNPVNSGKKKNVKRKR